MSRYSRGDSSGQAARVDRYRLNRMEHAYDFSGSVEPFAGSTASSRLARACDLSVHDSQRAERQAV